MIDVYDEKVQTSPLHIPANIVEGDTNILETEIIEGDHANKDD